MTLRVKGTNLSLKLDEDSLKAYALSAVIGRQKEVAGSKVHADQALSFLRKKHPDLEISYKKFVELVCDLANDGILTRETSNEDDPTYGFNEKYLKD